MVHILPSLLTYPCCQIEQGFHWIGPLGWVSLVVAVSVCVLNVECCPLPIQFISRPLNGHQIRWSVNAWEKCSKEATFTVIVRWNSCEFQERDCRVGAVYLSLIHLTPWTRCGGGWGAERQHRTNLAGRGEHQCPGNRWGGNSSAPSEETVVPGRS